MFKGVRCGTPHSDHDGKQNDSDDPVIEKYEDGTEPKKDVRENQSKLEKGDPKGRNEKKYARSLFFRSGFENLIFRRLQPLFFTVLKLYGREAGLSSGQ